jgi:transcriptional regulator with XRE-family HTH domain
LAIYKPTTIYHQFKISIMNKVSNSRQLTSIAAIRRALGYSQNYLAQLLGIPRSSLSMMESGRRSMPTPAFITMTNLEIERQAQKGAAAKELDAATAYNFLRTLQKTDGQALINKINNELVFCEWKKNTLGWQRSSLIAKSQAIDTKLAELNDELPDLALMVTLLPAGQVKDETEWKLKGLQQQQSLLEEQRRTAMLSIFKKQRETAGLEAGIKEAKVSILAITDRLNSIPG